jgi:hypothetical protein
MTAEGASSRAGGTSRLRGTATEERTEARNHAGGMA